MRKFILCLFTLGLFVPTLSTATTMGPIEIYKCPKSGQLFKQRTLNSGNNIGMVGWSDGYQDLPMYPETPEIVKCSDGEFIWLSKDHLLGTIPSSDGRPTPKTWQTATPAEFLTPTLYLEAIEKGQGDTPDHLKYLRTQAWWGANDAVREKKTSESPFLTASPLRDSLEKLAASYDQAQSDGLMMKAEALREMGKFDEALALLKAKVPKEYTTARDKIMKWAKEKNAVVGILFQDKN